MKITIETLKEAFGDDLEITIAVSESLISSEAQLRLRLVAALKDGSSDEIKSAIHAIKGAISVFGESSLYSKVKLIDQDLKSGGGLKTQSSIQFIPDEFLSFVEEIKNAIRLHQKVNP